MRGYTCLYSDSPRSFLFSVVANVGPRGASRSLAVAYRQGRDRDASPLTIARVEQVVAETLALVEILSDPANRTPLEAERALAEDWYRRSQRGSEAESSERPSVPDAPQPPFVVPDGRHPVRQAQLRPDLPWCDDALVEFPFITTCLLLGLLRDDGDDDTNFINSNSARLSDVQLQPLSTVFRDDCAEYGLVVLDISDLDSGVKYGIVGFPVRYMAEVSYRGENFGWDPVEDPPPEKEPDIVPISLRPRVPLSIFQWLNKYFPWAGLESDPSALRLEDRPLVDAVALDYIWPPELENQTVVENNARGSSQGVISSISDYFWPPKSTTRTKDASTTTATWLTMPYEPPRNAHMDRAIDNLITFTREPADLHLDEKTIDKFQKLAEFREQLRQRLEEVPDSLGPSSEASGHILRVAYAGCKHLNWVSFNKLEPGVIAAAIASHELRGASALSLCVDNFKLEGEDGGLGDLAAALAQSTALKQLCFLQGPGRDSGNISARFCTQLLRGRPSGDLGWLREKIIYPTCAFSTSLRSHKFASPSFAGVAFDSSVVQVFPVIHMFTFVGNQCKDATDADHLNSHYYGMGNTLLDAERFAVRFVSYLHSVGSGSDKAILRFAYGGPASSLATDDKSPPSLSSGRLAVSPIPTGFFGNHPPANDQSRVGVRDIHPGSWVLLLDQRGRSSSDDDDVFLQYSFVRVSAGIAPKQQHQRPVSVPHLVEVVCGLSDFLRETMPGIDSSTYEKRVETEKDRARRASIGTGKCCAGIGVMAESTARALIDQLLSPY